MEKESCVIIDLEGTLTNCTHRIKYLENRVYDKWNEYFSQDTINNDVKIFIERWNKKGFHIILSTAKSITQFDQVMNWLDKYKIRVLFSEFYFRPEDRIISRSVDIKAEHVEQIKQNFLITLAVDDRKENCDMYTQLGINTFIYNGKLIPYKPVNIKSSTPDQMLHRLAELFKKKNSEYGDSYMHFGKIMKAYFPNGIELKTEADFSRFAALNIAIAKTDRYCKNFTSGGHTDSLDDLAVYSAMLQHIDLEA